MVYVTRSPGDVRNSAYMGLNISREMIIYHSLKRPPASWPSSPSNTMYLQRELKKTVVNNNFGRKPEIKQKWILTAYSSCPLDSCDEALCRSPQTRDLVSHAQPCPPSSGLHPISPTLGGSTYKGRNRPCELLFNTQSECCFQQDLLSLNVKVQDAYVVNKYCKRSISQVRCGLPQNLI